MLRFTLNVLVLLALARASVAECSGSTSELATELGLAPEALVVACLSSSATTSVLHAIHDAAELRGVLELRRSSALQARADVSDAARELAATPDNPSLRDTFCALSATANQAQAQLEATEADLRSHALAGLPTVQQATIENIHAASAYSAPTEFGVVARTETQWRAIESALVAEQRAATNGTSIPEADAALLSAVRSDERVALAKQLLDSQLDVMVALFSQFD